MSGNQGSGLDRRQQDAYETRSTQIQHHLWRLQDEYEKLDARRPCVQIFDQCDEPQLHQRDAQLRASINTIRSLISDYNRAVNDWDAVIDEYRLQEDSSTWANQQLRHHTAYFEDPTVAPSLYFKLCELLAIYQDARCRLEELLQQRKDQADRTVLAPPGNCRDVRHC
ncbi:hypothetical protein AAVH_13736 [Aphelenchoides avenae]|nr:hypothetical protein AAVH_13736 [Aphelenchus avenae]